MARPPAFQWYPRDFAFATQSWTNEEVGAYMRLLNEAWFQPEPGHLPNDPARLAKLAHMSPRQWARCSPTILSEFKTSSCGTKIYNRRMVSTFQALESFSELQRARGKRGAEVRWSEDQDDTMATAIARPSSGDAPAMLRLSSGDGASIAGRWPSDGSAICNLQSADQNQTDLIPKQADLSLAPLVAGLPALPGKPSASQRRTVDRWRAEASKVLEAINAARRRLRPAARGSAPSYDSLAHIADRLEAGKTLEDCLHVVAVCEAECRAHVGDGRTADPFKWFDAISPFRPENFERKVIAELRPAKRAHVTYSEFRPLEPLEESK